MVYGFNDNKEKVAVVKEGDFRLYETEISGVSPSFGVSTKTITQDELGISDLENWMIVSVYQQYSNTHVWKTLFKGNAGEYPKAIIDESSQSLLIAVCNEDNSKRAIQVRVLLKRVSQ